MSAMKERGILYKAEMVRAILDNRKRMTRRTVKHIPMLGEPFAWCASAAAGHLALALTIGDYRHFCPYGEPGDQLWVRESFYQFGHWEMVPGVKTKTGRMKWRFVADSKEVRFDAPESYRKGRHHKDPLTPAWHKRLARFMPRWASRITLEITGVRVERLQDISEEDAKDEGAVYHDGGKIGHSGWRHDPAHGFVYSTARESFAALWQSINGPDSWAANPFVWVIEFERITP